MPSLSNIPEPTTAYRPPADEPDAPVLPLNTIEAEQPQPRRPMGQERASEGDQPEAQIDGVSCLLLLLIAGGLLRIVLGLFGPMQGVDAFKLQQFDDHGRLLFTGSPADAYPLFGAMTSGLIAIDMPDWLGVMIGSLLTLVAVPAAYIIGQATTGRRVAGALAAALVAVHPAVLTAANTASGTALAMSLCTIGLALVCLAAKRGTGYAVGGALAIALAGLAAPLCWLVGLIAAPLLVRLHEKDGLKRGLSTGLMVLVIAVGPVFGLRAAFFGTDFAGLLPEFDHSAAGEPAPPTDHLLITLTDPSLAEMGEAMHLPLRNAGRLTAYQTGMAIEAERRDPVADVLADAWLLMNAALAGLAMVSIGVLVARRRAVEAIALALPLAATAFCAIPPGEMLRLPMMAFIGVLAVGLVATRRESTVDLEAKAEKRAAKLAAREEKQRAKQERGAAKLKDGLYAFDKPTRREKKERRQQAKAVQAKTKTKAQAAEPAAGILTQRMADDSQAPARPI